MDQRLFKLLTAGVSLLALAACQTNDLDDSLQSRISSPGITVQVFPWADVKDDLASSITLSDKDALNISLPTAGASASSSLRSSNITAKIDLSPASLLPKSQITETESTLSGTSESKLTSALVQSLIESAENSSSSSSSSSSNRTLVITRDGDVIDITDTLSRASGRSSEREAEIVRELKDALEVNREQISSGQTNQAKKITSIEEAKAPIVLKDVDLSELAGADPGILAAALEDDPRRRYAAAHALKAQVSLLDEAIKQAEKRKGYKAYLIELQVNLNPKRRELNYDLQTIVNFALHQHGTRDGQRLRDAVKQLNLDKFNKLYGLKVSETEWVPKVLKKIAPDLSDAIDEIENFPTESAEKKEKHMKKLLKFVAERKRKSLLAEYEGFASAIETFIAFRKKVAAAKEKENGEEKLTSVLELVRAISQDDYKSLQKKSKDDKKSPVKVCSKGQSDYHPLTKCLKDQFEPIQKEIQNLINQHAGPATDPFIEANNRTEIIPLFSNVDFEKINLTDYAEVVRQATAGLRAQVNSFGIDLGGGHGNRNQESFVAKNLNALTSVNRVGERVFEIRTGAKWVGDRHKLVAPSQTVYAMMFLPEEVSYSASNYRLRALARQSLIDGDSGMETLIGERNEYIKKMAAIVENFNLRYGYDLLDGMRIPISELKPEYFRCKNADHKVPSGLISKRMISEAGRTQATRDKARNKNKIEFLETKTEAKLMAEIARLSIQKRVLQAWSTNDTRTFEYLDCLSGGTADIQDISLQLAKLSTQNPYAVDQSYIPPVKKPKIKKKLADWGEDEDLQDQLVYYASTKDKLIVRLAAPTNLDLNGVTAEVQVIGALAGSEDTANLRSETILADKGYLYLSFPPVKRPAGQENQPIKLNTVLLKQEDSKNASIEFTKLYNVADVNPNKYSAVRISTGISRLTVENGDQAAFELDIKGVGDAKFVRLSLSNAQFAGSPKTDTPSAIRQVSANAYVLPSNKIYKLKLGKLIPGTDLFLTVQGYKTKEAKEKVGDPVSQTLMLIPQSEDREKDINISLKH